MNARLLNLQPYPFQRLKELLSGLEQPKDLKPISLAIGEPRHPTPKFIQDTLAQNLHGLATYPSTIGTDTLRESFVFWLNQRFNLLGLDPTVHVLPTLGSREALFSITQVILDPAQTSQISLCPNPFYQIYEGATILAGGTPWFIPCTAENNYAPDYDAIPPHVWNQVRLIYVCSPGNPSGHVMSLAEWGKLFELSDRYQFTIVSDECYIDIYPTNTTPPLGGLEAAYRLGRTNFNQLVSLFSLSKRSSVPGLRSGFIAGDTKILKQFLLYRTYHGSAMSPTVQQASAAAWTDEQHVIENRQAYSLKMERFYDLVNPYLPLEKPNAGFYYWAKTPIDDTRFTQHLFHKQGLSVLPGQYLSRIASGQNPGLNRIRLALVGTLSETEEAAQRLVHSLHTLPSLNKESL